MGVGVDRSSGFLICWISKGLDDPNFPNPVRLASGTLNRRVPKQTSRGPGRILFRFPRKNKETNVFGQDQTQACIRPDPDLGPKMGR